MQILRFDSPPRLWFVACLITLGLSAAGAAAGESEEIEFARSVVKTKLETERTGTKIDWINPETETPGRMRIVETQILDHGLACRWYEWSVEAGSDTKIETFGKGCRLGNGEWLLEETAVVRKTLRIRVPAEVEQPAAEPKDPMAEVTFTRPETMAGIDPDETAGPDGGGAERGTWQED
jgi:hypothetical protein